MVPEVVITREVARVLVQPLGGAAGLVAMAIAMRVQDVRRPKQAGQGASDGRIVEHLSQHRQARQDVVAPVALAIEDGARALAQVGVE